MRRTHHALCVLAILVATPLLLLARQQPEATYIVRGRVVAADDPASPLRGARVMTLGGATAAPLFTDEAGEFRVSVPGDYSLAISKAGFAAATVTGRATSQPADLTVRLVRGAVIEGQVVDSSGFPVSNARVRVRRVDAVGGGSDLVADTDDDGTYRIGSLPAGRYQLHSERAAPDNMFVQPYLDMQLRVQPLQRAAVPITPMSEIATVDLRPGGQSAVILVHKTYAVLPPDAPIGGFVSGVVSDEFGDPLAGVDVQLWQLRYSGGRYYATPTGRGGSSSPMTFSPPRRTDDRGYYRFFYVKPGRYIVTATVDDARVAPVYYPGVTTVGSAMPIEVGRKQEVSGVMIRFRRSYEARVYGFAVNAAGEALRGALSLQARHRAGQVELPPRMVTVNPDATFEFLNVPPGEYVLASITAGGGGPEFAMQLVSVGGPEVPPITIRTGPMATMTGRIEMEGGGASGSTLFQAVPDPDYPVRPAFSPRDEFTAFASAQQHTSEARILDALAPNADGSFQMRGLAGPVRFTVPNPPPPGVWLKAVTIGGVNAVEEPVMFNGPDSSRTDVRVVFASSAGGLSGRVFDERGDRAEDYRVVVFSTNRDRWFAGSQFVRITAGPNADDRFTMTSLPPGDYFAAAIDGIDGDMDSGDWQNPDVLAALSTRAQRVTVGERQRVSADLRLIRWAR